MKARSGAAIEGDVTPNVADHDASGGPNDTEWYRALGHLIEDTEAERLPRRLVEALIHVVPFEWATIFAYRGRSRPLHIYGNFEHDGAKKGIAAYIENTYVLNPLYQALQRGLADGVYRIRDLAPDAYFESEYYRTHRILPGDTEEIGYVTEGWPEGFEEIGIIVVPEPGVTIELSVYRSLRRRDFSDDELIRLTTLLPVLRPLWKRFWVGHGTAGAKASPLDSRVDDAFADFGKSVLTGREREVMQHILRGHSSESICFSLGISMGTVKTHRKNAYAKLNISSQSELLSLFLQSLHIP